MVIAKNVGKTFEDGIVALDNVTFLINNGEFVFLVGASGAGKTTLIKMFLREEVPTEGEFVINDKNIAQLKNRDIPYFRRTVGVVFQDFRLLPDKTVYENIEFAMLVVGVPRKIRRKRIPEVLNQVGLTARAKAYPDNLSGGEKQRVAIARAIVNRPPILIADEPTGNLDPENAWEIMNLLDDINKKGTTVIVATHAKEIVDTMQRRVIELVDGKLVRDEEKGVYGHENE
ncbi:MAG: cell division ATP-binding protein FtsE [Clostridia bacterium]|nr:cell division ATP-binding protein FtsE [Clostridia bacterium]